jgi:hypothetical protein
LIENEISTGILVGTKGWATSVKLLRTSLLSAFIINLGCTALGVFGALRSDLAGRIAEIIYSPSFYIAGLLLHFRQGGRSDIFRDVAIVFLIQWLLYSLVIFIVLKIRAGARNRASVSHSPAS